MQAVEFKRPRGVDPWRIRVYHPKGDRPRYEDAEELRCLNYTVQGDDALAKRMVATVERAVTEAKWSVAIEAWREFAKKGGNVHAETTGIRNKIAQIVTTLVRGVCPVRTCMGATWIRALRPPRACPRG